MSQAATLIRSDAGILIYDIQVKDHVDAKTERLEI